MWKTLWINVKNFYKNTSIPTFKQVQNFIPSTSTTFPQFSSSFSQDLLVEYPHINNPYYYYLFLKVETINKESYQ